MDVSVLREQHRCRLACGSNGLRLFRVYERPGERRGYYGAGDQITIGFFRGWNSQNAAAYRVIAQCSHSDDIWRHEGTRGRLLNWREANGEQEQAGLGSALLCDSEGWL